MRELHADYMAGYYLGRKGLVTSSGVEEFATSLFEKGDYNFTSPQHHGTPIQRVAAMRGGYDDAQLSTIGAYAKGQRVVKRIVRDDGNSGDDDPQGKPERQSVPRHRQPAPASVCQTEYGACPLVVLMPRGVVCSCYTAYGEIRGLAR